MGTSCVGARRRPPVPAMLLPAHARLPACPPAQLPLAAPAPTSPPAHAHPRGAVSALVHAADDARQHHKQARPALQARALGQVGPRPKGVAGLVLCRAGWGGVEGGRRRAGLETRRERQARRLPARRGRQGANVAWPGDPSKPLTPPSSGAPLMVPARTMARNDASGSADMKGRPRRTARGRGGFHTGPGRLRAGGQRGWAVGGRRGGRHGQAQRCRAPPVPPRRCSQRSQCPPVISRWRRRLSRGASMLSISPLSTMPAVRGRSVGRSAAAAASGARTAAGPCPCQPGPALPHAATA